MGTVGVLPETVICWFSGDREKESHLCSLVSLLGRWYLEKVWLVDDIFSVRVSVIVVWIGLVM